MPKNNLRIECRELAQQITALPHSSPEALWLKTTIARLLLDRTIINELSCEYQEEQDIQNPYLADLVNQFDEYQ